MVSRPGSGGGGGLEYKKRGGCSSRILKLTPKGDQLTQLTLSNYYVARAFFDLYKRLI